MEIVSAIISHKYNDFKWYASVGCTLLMFIFAVAADFGFITITVIQSSLVTMILVVILSHLSVALGFFFFSKFLFFKRKEKRFLERGDDNYVVFEQDERQQLKVSRSLFILFWAIVLAGFLLRFVETILYMAM